MKNTSFLYMYRDADNYKVAGVVVCSGLLDETRRLALGELDDFIPQQVGMAPLQHLLQAYDVTDNRRPDGTYDPYGDYGVDHMWHEFQGMEDSHAAPTDPRSACELADELLREQARGWDDLKFLGCSSEVRAGVS